MHRIKNIILACCAAVLVSGCGGGSSTEPNVPATPAPVTPPVIERNSVSLSSDQGDALGLGKSYQYGSADTFLTFTANKNQLIVTVTGEQEWVGVFQTGNQETEIKLGAYVDLPAYIDGENPSGGSLTWHGEQRSCQNASSGMFIVDRVVYANGALLAIDLRFERRCSTSSGSLHGEVHYVASDTTKPPGHPSVPPPDLWRPPADISASVGNYVYLESGADDYVGLGQKFFYGPKNATFKVTKYTNDALINIIGDERWRGRFRAMDPLLQLEAGYYSGLRSVPFNNPVKGGLAFTGEGRGCSAVTGWFVVDSITYDNDGLIVSLDLRFEQHCEGREPALRGAIHWRAAPTPPAETVSPSPVGSWFPASGATPVNGNYVYLQSDALDPLGGGRTYLHTSSNTVFSVSASGNELHVEVAGAQHWNGNFRTQGQSSFAIGTYDGLTSVAYTD